jgi:hypothetical protein
MQTVIGKQRFNNEEEKTMFKRLVLIGALVISAVAMSSTHANAQFFDGWGWFGFSDIRGEIKTSKTPNPQGRPSQITVTVNATIQIACINPGNNGVFNGVAFHRPLTSSIPVDPADVDDKGDATTVVFVPLSQFEVSANCPNKKWTPVTNSAMALDFSGTVLWCLVENGGPNCTRKGLLDESPVTCSLDTTNPQNQRDPLTGEAPHTAVFTCSAPQ